MFASYCGYRSASLLYEEADFFLRKMEEKRLESMLQKIGAIVWGWPMMALFVGTGILFTVRLRAAQFRKLGKALRLSCSQEQGSGISPYAALCTALAATIGTGNIVGVATALSTGGPGALFWMLIAAFFGMATQYAEGFLSVKYRKKVDGKWFGGPFCYIELGLGKKKKWLALTFAAIGAAAGVLGVGTVTQVNSITSAVDGFFSSPVAFQIGTRSYSWAIVLSGAIVAGASAAVLLGGVKRISKVCETLVPLMSAAYVICSVILLVCCAERIPSAIRLIFRSAFSPKAVLGATAGISLKMAMRMGIGRGVFTNEAGLGSTAIASGASGERDPVRQGLVSMTGTFIDTIVICTMTGLCLVVTGAWNMPTEGVGLTDQAWRAGLPWAESLSSFILMVCLVFFAFATIIGWNFYAESCLRYLTNRKRVQKAYRIAYLTAVFLGPYLSVNAAWEMADILNALMAFPNLFALFLLQNDVVLGTNRKQGEKL